MCHPVYSILINHQLLSHCDWICYLFLYWFFRFSDLFSCCKCRDRYRGSRDYYSPSRSVSRSPRGDKDYRSPQRSLSPRGNSRRSLSPRGNNRRSLSPVEDRGRRSLSPREDRGRSLSPREDRRRSLSPRENSRRSLSPRENSRRSSSPRENSRRSLSPRENRRSPNRSRSYRCCIWILVFACILIAKIWPCDFIVVCSPHWWSLWLSNGLGIFQKSHISWYISIDAYVDPVDQCSSLVELDPFVKEFCILCWSLVLEIAVVCFRNGIAVDFIMTLVKVIWWLWPVIQYFMAVGIWLFISLSTFFNY